MACSLQSIESCKCRKSPKQQSIWLDPSVNWCRTDLGQFAVVENSTCSILQQWKVQGKNEKWVQRRGNMGQYSKETCGPFTFSELQPQGCGCMSFFLSCAQPFPLSCLALGGEGLTHTVSRAGDWSGDVLGRAHLGFKAEITLSWKILLCWIHTFACKILGLLKHPAGIQGKQIPKF